MQHHWKGQSSAVGWASRNNFQNNIVETRELLPLQQSEGVGSETHHCQHHCFSALLRPVMNTRTALQKSPVSPQLCLPTAHAKKQKIGLCLASVFQTPHKYFLSVEPNSLLTVGYKAVWKVYVFSFLASAILRRPEGCGLPSTQFTAPYEAVSVILHMKKRKSREVRSL